MVPLPPPAAGVAPAPASDPSELVPEPHLGAAGVEAPAQVVRAQNLQDSAMPPRLLVTVDFDRATFRELGDKLEKASFVLLDGDGETWRVQAPAGRFWSERLIALPEVASVSSGLDRDLLPSGNFREGGATYGAHTLRFTYPEGGPPVMSMPGFMAPEPTLPRAAGRELIRCLSPLRSDLVDGVSAGPGWERALIEAPPAWVLLLSGYGACGASGWVLMSADGGLEGLEVGGEPAASASDEHYFELAARFLSLPRGNEDDTAAAAFDILRVAPDTTLARHLPALAPSSWQVRLYEELERRLPEAARSVASTSSSPLLLAQAAGQDPALRERLFASPDTSVYVLRSIVGTAPAPVLERLRGSEDPVLRGRAWAETLAASFGACDTELKQSKDSKDVLVWASLYERCPMPAVRSQVFQRLMTVDRIRATELVEATLSAPETVECGVNAVRHANTLERDELLVAVVGRNTIDREVRLAALKTLGRTRRHAGFEALVGKHAVFLGYVEPQADGSAAGAPR